MLLCPRATNCRPSVAHPCSAATFGQCTLSHRRRCHFVLSVSRVQNDAELAAWARRRLDFAGAPPLIATTVPPASLRTTLERQGIINGVYLDLRADKPGVDGELIGLAHPRDLALAKPFFVKAQQSRHPIEMLVVDRLGEVNLDTLRDVVSARWETQRR